MDPQRHVMSLLHSLPFTTLALAFVLSAAAEAHQDSAHQDSAHQDSARAEWEKAEHGILENHVQLTSSDFFRKAGECYFSPDGRQIIFQAIEKKATPEEEEAFYQMYVADLVFEGSRVTGIERVKRLTPPGSASTCGWFHPTERGVVIFGCTIVPPSDPGKTGYQRKTSRYSWQFPKEMDIVRCVVAKADGTAATLERLVSDPEAYLAECVISPDGKSMIFCEHRVSDGSNGGDLWIMDLETKRRVSAATGAGYDGGPFFSPDGKRICYRSDRRGDDLLQIFVGELAFDRSGNILGVQREFQLTDNGHVNWAPYWHPNGRFLIYASSEVGHDNYEVFMVDADAGDGGPTRYGTRRRRITFAPKFDGLPVFNLDGSRMMWTCQRSADQSSQVWIADFVAPLDGTPAASAEEEVGSLQKGAHTEDQLQVQDPSTGLYYIYDRNTHELSVYDPVTHQVRAANPEESTRAMQLFKDN